MANPAIMEIIFSIIVIIFSIIIHEISHGWAAYALGDPTAKLAGRLTLNPLSHLDPIGSFVVPLLTYSMLGGLIFGWAKPVPYNPYNLRAGKWGPALVAIAGPVSNLFLAAIFSLIIRLSVGVAPVAFIQLSIMIVLINLGLALFNLIPVPPLDGSKILFALIPYRYRQIEEVLTRYQLLWIIVVIYAIAPLLSPLIGFLFSFLTGFPI